MKKILMVSCGGLGNGGVQAIMMGIVRSLHTECHIDMLVFTSEERHYDKEFLSYGTNLFRISHYEGRNSFFKRADNYIRDLYIYKKVVQLLKDNGPYDVVHCNKQYESAAVLRAAAKQHVPIRICHTHVISFPGSGLGGWLNRIRLEQIRKYTTDYVGCSEEACKTFFPVGTSYRVINNFYDDRKYCFTPLDYYNGTVIITQVGALSDIKNQRFAVQVVKEINEMGIDAELNIIGFELQGGYKEKLLSLITDKGIASKVIFHPEDCNIRKILDRSHVFLLPSKHEGFGIALIEAQAVGVKCFASNYVPRSTNCGNVTYLDIDGQNASSKWAEEISKSGLSHIHANTDMYKMSKVIKQYRMLYNRI